MAQARDKLTDTPPCGVIDGSSLHLMYSMRAKNDTDADDDDDDDFDARNKQ